MKLRNNNGILLSLLIYISFIIFFLTVISKVCIPLYRMTFMLTNEIIILKCTNKEKVSGYGKGQDYMLTFEDGFEKVKSPFMKVKKGTVVEFYVNELGERFYKDVHLFEIVSSIVIIILLSFLLYIFILLIIELFTSYRSPLLKKLSNILFKDGEC
ncbi:hypothetical protein [Flammeovirga sp. SJP92]|uniref:hypothetical protein n=1 Tax=Flammeovirga sp. SJP92 TaxID=1775430 RepID=UPI0007885EF3|nr:hypothetical protein [Flammeovirga sp. SJP92]KXX72215.1 hypothetical protein AVL50_01035 [Flammeovirga sp. SJP92]